MSQIIIDINAKKYREVECNMCGGIRSVDLEESYEDDYGNKVQGYYCRRCDNYFELEQDETEYEEGSYYEDKWKELEEGMDDMI